MPMSVNLNSNMFQLLHNLHQLNADREVSMQRIATGKRINRAADDPSGVVALAGLAADLARVNASLENNQRSKAILDTADSALAEVSKMVSEIGRLANAARDPNATSAQIAGYQSAIDQHLDTIDNLISKAEYAGKKIFAGNNAISASTAQSKYKDLRVWSAANATSDKVFSIAFSAANNEVTVDGTVVGKATANGDEVTFTKDGYTVSLTITDVSADITASNVTVTKGTGMLFQTGTDSSTQVRVDLAAGVTSSKLGDYVQGYLSSLRSGGANALSVANNKAAEIANKAATQVAVAQSRVGSFNKYQVQSSINVLQAAATGLTNAMNSLQNVDAAMETAKLERQNALYNAGITMLSLASSNQNAVFALLRNL